MDDPRKMQTNWFDNYLIEFNNSTKPNYNISNSSKLLINMDEYVILNIDDVEKEESLVIKSSYYKNLKYNIKKILYDLKN